MKKQYYVTSLKDNRLLMVATADNAIEAFKMATEAGKTKGFSDFRVLEARCEIRETTHEVVC